MSEDRHATPIEETLDRELDVRSIVGVGVVVLVLMAVSAAVLGWGWSFMNDRLDAREAAPPALPEARQQTAPPAPRLEASPPASLADYLEEQRHVLDSWGWVEEGSVARIPIDRALELAAEGVLPLERIAPSGEGAEGAAP
ncbi:MAG: hypothetical protein R3190_01305 [Thermoanaerobaculia bacterium]|nr:hypothetical protein [Thermoanaerobaculia bacterium]